jgi:signal transduction histidine kinase
MQARIPRSESQEVVGRVVDTVNGGEDLILLKTEVKSSLPSHSGEISQPSHTLLEVTSSRRLMQVMTTTPTEKILPEIAQVLAELFGAEGCIISVQAKSQSKIAAWFDSRLSTPQQSEILSNYSAIEAETLQQSCLLISDLWEDRHELSQSAARAAISVVTHLQNQVNGVICLLCSHPHHWTEAEVNTLTNISDQVAIAISQTTLRQQVSKQAQFQALVRDVTLSIQNSTDLPQVLNAAIEGTAQVLQADRGFLLRLKFWDPRHSLRTLDRIPKARVIIDAAWSREPRSTETSEEEALSQSFWISECLICQSVMSSATKSLTLAERTDFPQKTETTSIAPIFDPEAMSSLMLVPLESKNRLLGFIVMQQRQARRWQQEEIELAEMIGGQISSAILQSETLRQVESLVEERTAQLQQSLELQAKLYDMTRKQIDKLREMNQRMDEFLSTLSHELRTPLTSMMLAIRMLRQADLSPERQAQYLNILEQQCVQETNLINDLLALQELETKQVAFQLQKVDISQVIQEVVSSFSQRWSLKGLQLEIDLPKRSPIFNTDLASLNRILLELFTNAGKYAEPNSTVRLSVAQQPGQQIQIALANIGSGISEEELPYIFDKFRRCQGMTQNAVPGTGLGLALVKSLVQHLNGKVIATSELHSELQSHETTFVVTLPQNLEIGKE